MDPSQTQQEQYHDRLVDVDGERVRFHWYYFPFIAKSVPLDDIQDIQVLPPGMLNGSWRIWGSGDLATWFSHDLSRPKRKRIFVLTRRSGGWRIGFTVQDHERFEEVMEQRGVHLVPPGPRPSLAQAKCPRIAMFFGILLLVQVLYLIGGSVPLIVGAVGPNETYGFRTAQTLANEQLWYAVNRFLGWVTLLVNLPAVALPVVVLGKRQVWPWWSGIAAMMILGLINAVVAACSFAYQAYLLHP